MNPVKTRTLPRPAAEAAGAMNGAVSLGAPGEGLDHSAGACGVPDDAARQNMARRRLERYQEEKRLNQALREVFEDEERF